MIKPTYEAYFGYKLSVEVIAFEELPDHQLHWLNMAPDDVLNKTQQARRLSYDHSTEEETDKGKLEMAIYQQEEDSFAILLVRAG